MKTLYLLRRSYEKIQPSVFLPSETEGDVVLLEKGESSVFSHSKGRVFSLSLETTHESLSYDGMIEQIFSHDHVIVV